MAFSLPQHKNKAIRSQSDSIKDQEIGLVIDVFLDLMLLISWTDDFVRPAFYECDPLPPDKALPLMALQRSYQQCL